VSSFAQATAVEPLGDGAWRATCDGGWSTELGPNGGYLAAIVLRTMSAELADPARHARSLTCHYLRPPREGELRVEVTVERSGRSLSTLTARLSQGDRRRIVALGAFAIALDGVLDYNASPPAAPALAMPADAWWPSPMPRLTRPASLPTVDLTVHFRSPPAADGPVLAVFRSSTSAGGFFEEDGELWSRDGVLLAHSRQLALLVAA
jgi:acyl-CoA thioesterase